MEPAAAVRAETGRQHGRYEFLIKPDEPQQYAGQNAGAAAIGDRRDRSSR
jgi:hypothetical protein